MDFNIIAALALIVFMVGWLALDKRKQRQAAARARSMANHPAGKGR